LILFSIPGIRGSNLPPGDRPGHKRPDKRVDRSSGFGRWFDRALSKEQERPAGLKNAGGKQKTFYSIPLFSCFVIGVSFVKMELDGKVVRKHLEFTSIPFPLQLRDFLVSG
jgi:hypothetical protein